MPMPNILDRYVASNYIRVAALSALGMAGIFYISTFLDLADEVFKGQATWSMLGEYFWYATPQYLYFIIPLAVLLATLVTIGLLTKNSELIVMKACGISLYRVALPMFVGAVIGSGMLFLLEQSVLGPSNRRADAVRHVIRGGSPQTFDILNRRWIVGRAGEIYHYNYFDPRTRRLDAVSIYEFDPGMTTLRRRVYAEHALYVGGDAEEQNDIWYAEKGWTREFDPKGEPRTFNAFDDSQLAIEPAAYFETQQPDPDYMSYSQLRGYIARLRDSGFDVVAAVADGDALLTAVEEHSPDVAIVDVRLPPAFRDEGVRAALELRRRRAGFPVLILSQYVEQTYASELLADGTGGVGYLLKDRVSDVRDFVEAVRRVAGGGMALDPEAVSQLVAGHDEGGALSQLSTRERAVLALMAEGRTNHGIADELEITPSGVEKHVASIFGKLGLPPAESAHRRVLAVVAWLGG